MRATMNYKNGKWHVKIGESKATFETSRSALRFINLWHIAVGNNVW